MAHLVNKLAFTVSGNPPFFLFRSKKRLFIVLGLNGPYLHTSLPQDNQHFIYMHFVAPGYGETTSAQSGPGPWPTTLRKK